ncbi:Ig-like domain-containing protein [Latilactobacillus sakei]|uniref:Ig-like domain-containing protein n=1 Tax=Latilactobacillus sakei TaxID=1599 RepID=UPI001F4C111E|nr:Ig-like domain-containing protein [Latilactobacillus sakei]
MGETKQLKETVSPADAADKSVTWSSSDETVASVSTSGLVTAKVTGNTKITVKTTDGSFTGDSNITVTDND